MYPNQGGYRPQQNAQQYGGPPPAKKPKGNPIITRYPPPPGYRGPAQPHPQFLPPPTWQQPLQAPGYGGFPGYQQPQFQQLQFQQPQFQPPLAQTPGYPYQHPQHPLPAQPVPQPFQQPVFHASPQYPQNVQHGGFQPPQSRKSRRSASLPHHRNASGALLDGNGEIMPPLEDNGMFGESLEEEFDGECYFARYPEEINPDLSLGIIEWKPPLPTRRALPSTFDEAELEALAPRKPLPADEESVSDYFVVARREEAFHSVRQTDDWHKIKDSLIFREFPAICMNLISLQELLARYRVRYDPDWASESEAESRSPTPDLSRGPTPSRTVSGYSMEIDQERAEAIPSKEMTDVPAHHQQPYLDDLEQALRNNRRNSHHNQNNGNNFRPNHRRNQSHSHSRAGSVVNHTRAHSRANSVFSSHSRAGSVGHHSRAGSVSHSRALPKVRDQNQEDILASLGVEGSPSQVYETPGPAFGPPPTEAEKAKAAHSRANSVGNVHAAPFTIPPPPPGRPPYQSRDQYYNNQRRNSRDAWADSGRNSTSGQRPPSRPTSSSSHRTATGSDFGDIPEENEPTPRADRRGPGFVGQGRKRSYADLKGGAGIKEEDGEETPRARKVGRRASREEDDVYGRRW